MKRLLISTAAVALMSTGALAADLPVIEPVQEVLPVPVAATWSGFYVGLHGGYGWSDLEVDDDDFDFDFDDDDDDDDDDFFDDNDLEGFVVGGQIGYNWQVNYFLFGIEGDASYSDISSDDDDDFFDDDDDDVDFGLESEIDFLASVRGRLGLAFDRFLVYGTGGVGFASFDTELDGDDDFDDFFDDDDDGDDSDIETGIVYGGGAEFLVTDNVSLGVEYLHYDFDADEIDVPTFAGVAAFDSPDAEVDVDVIRGRVNVKFDSIFGGGAS